MIGAEAGQLTIHRLVQAVTRGQLDEATAKARAKTAVQLVNAAVPRSAREHPNWPMIWTLFPHALAADEAAGRLGLDQCVVGLLEALGEYADQVYKRLSTAQQAAAKRLFMSLVKLGEGEADTRARIILPADPTMLEVVEIFAGTEARIIVIGDVAGNRSVEISHEALIRYWGRLWKWIAENRESLHTRAILVADRAEWLKQNRHHSLLIKPGPLLEAARWLCDQQGDVIIDDIKDYIDASLVRNTHHQLWRFLGLPAAILGRVAKR